MLDPIIKTIEVPCSQEKAFGVFVNKMDSWWPLGNFSVSAMGGEYGKALHVEPKQGGKIVEISPDDTEHLWSTVKSYDPHDFFSMYFHIPQPTKKVESRSLVEVRFTVLGDEQTRVELTQNNNDAWRLGRYFWAGIQIGLQRLTCGATPTPRVTSILVRRI